MSGCMHRLKVFPYYNLQHERMKTGRSATMHNHDVILAELGDRLGLSLTFDENSQCLLILDQKLMVSIRKETSAWLFYGLIEADVQWREKAFWQTALTINLDLVKSGGGSISYEPDSCALMYVHCLEIKRLDVDSAYAFLESFVDQLEGIGKHPLFQQ